MRRGTVLSMALVLGATGASSAAPQATSAAPQATPVPQATAADAGVQLATLQRDMHAAQAEITRLRDALAAQREAEAQIALCRAKNARLVAIADGLIASYDARYRKGAFLPFDTGRRKLQAELQDRGDEVYDNRVEAAPRAPASTAPPKDD